MFCNYICESSYIVGMDDGSFQFPKTLKVPLEGNINDISSDSDLSDVDSGEFFEINESEFANEENWLTGGDSNCNSIAETPFDVFKALYAETDEFQVDVSEICSELRLLRNPSSPSEPARCNNRTALIDSRTFTRPKKCSSRPALASIISGSIGDEIRQGRVQGRSAGAVSPTRGILNKYEDLSGSNNRAWVYGVRRDNNWEEGSEEGLADIGNPSGKSNRKPVAGSNDSKKVRAASDLYAENALSSSGLSDIIKNIPGYFSDDDESFSLDSVSCFCEDLSLASDFGNHSSLSRETERNEICLYHNSSPAEGDPRSLKRFTFGGLEIPWHNAPNTPERTPGKSLLIHLDDNLNKSYEGVNNPPSVENSAYHVKQGDSQSEEKVINRTYNLEKNQDLIDVILKSDIIKNYNYRNCDNKNILNNMGDTMVINVNESFTQNELNKRHSEKYTTKIFDASFRKSSSPPDRPNGKKERDHSEDDCMSTTSDNSCKSVDSNSELRNIEELKNIALQQSMKLSDVKFSTPKLEFSKLSNRESKEWRNVSPITRDTLDGESQGSSNASSRGPSPRGIPVPSGHEDSKKAQVFKMRQPPKVPQRELKLKPVMARPLQNFQKPGRSVKPSNESVVMNSTKVKNECKTSASAPGIPVIKPSIVPPAAVSSVPNPNPFTYKSECKTSASAPGIPAIKPSIVPPAAVSSVPNSKPVTRIPSGIPRPPSRLKQPQIRASEVRKK